MEILLNLTFIPIIIFLNLYLKKKNFLVNYSGLKHQLYTNQNSVPISGGLILLISAIIALIISNSSYSEIYFNTLDQKPLILYPCSEQNYRVPIFLS